MTKESAKEAGIALMVVSPAIVFMAGAAVYSRNWLWLLAIIPFVCCSMGERD